MLSPQSKYALRAMIYLSQQTSAEFVRVDVIAEQTNLPSAFLSKIFKSLAQAKIIISRRGRNGGVQLNPKKSRITFFDICLAVEDPIVKSECILFKKLCDKDKPCAFHGKWSKTKARFIEFLAATAL
jgi:Rrf2 family iron-sulfur cluster assembly transcriptional regulator